MPSWCDLKYLRSYLEFDAQPIVKINDGSVVGHELLARLSLGDKRLSPEFFIPVLENHGLYSELDRLLALNAVEFLALAQGDGFVSVNIQSIESLVSHLNNPVYDGYQTRIHFELLESVEWSGTDSLLAINSASGKGFKVFLDDFGSGLSNLRTLLSADLYGVKVDRFVLLDFIENEAVHTLKLLVDFLMSGNKQIIFEGVELPNHEEFIKSLNVDVYVQGFLYGKPK